MDLQGLRKIGELLGADKKTLDKAISNLQKEKEINDIRNTLNLDFTHKDVEGNHKKMFDACKKVLWVFKDADEVECDNSLINENMMEAMWSNLDAYSYDIETFFLDKFIFYLKDGKRVQYKMYVSIEDKNSIFLYVKGTNDKDIVCGSIIAIDGKFLPFGAMDERLVPFFRESHKNAGLDTSTQYIADRTLMNCLLYIIIINQMVNKNREVITETSRRIEVQGKKKPSKKAKKQPKKTKVIRYIKVDGEKIKKIRQEQERVERESFERHTDEWSRRGHMRRLRNGEVKWIAPTVCHAKEKVGTKVQKLYKIK